MDLAFPKFSQGAIWWWRGAICCGVIGGIAIYYLALLSNFTFELFAPEALGKTFNSMLMHLLRGDFGVDRQAIGFEAFTRDGKTYSYFGVFPAVLRLLALPFVDMEHAELARLSQLAAEVVYVVLQLATLRVVQHSIPAPARSTSLYVTTAVATVLSGPQLYLLASASVYHEAVFWAAVFGAAFNLVVVHAAFTGKGLSGRDLALLALFASLALHSRVPVGVGLCVSATSLTIWVAALRHIPAQNWDGIAHGFWRAIPRMLGDPRLLFPAALMGLFVIGIGIVNDERWGSPFRFVDFQAYDLFLHYPQRLKQITEHGVYDLNRIGVSFLYYSTGIPYLIKNIPPFDDYLASHFDGLAAPPIAPVLVNPLTVIFAAVGLYRLFRAPDLPAGGGAIVWLALLGHFLLVLMTLAFMSMALRYRLDLAPFMTLAAFVGYRSASIAITGSERLMQRRVRNAAIVLCVGGILASHYTLLVYKITSHGVPMPIREALLPWAPFAHAALDK